MRKLQENKPFQIQLQDVTRGINRIRYLKQKINSTFSTLRGVDHNQQFNLRFIATSETSKNSKSQFNIKSRNIHTVQSERNKQSSIAKDGKFRSVNLKSYFKNCIRQKRWDDSSNWPKGAKQSSRDQNFEKLQTFYRDNLIKNLKRNEKDEIPLQKLKKYNYSIMKLQKQQLNKRVKQEKENRKQQIMKQKQKVVVHKRMARKKVDYFMLQKLEDIHKIKFFDKNNKRKKLLQQLEMQNQLENQQSQRLKQFQNSIALKYNMKAILEQRVSVNNFVWESKNQELFLQQGQSKSTIQVVDLLALDQDQQKGHHLDQCFLLTEL